MAIVGPLRHDNKKIHSQLLSTSVVLDNQVRLQRAINFAKALVKYDFSFEAFRATSCYDFASEGLVVTYTIPPTVQPGYLITWLNRETAYVLKHAPQET